MVEGLKDVEAGPTASEPVWSLRCHYTGQPGKFLCADSRSAHATTRTASGTAQAAADADDAQLRRSDRAQARYATRDLATQHLEARFPQARKATQFRRVRAWVCALQCGCATRF